MMPTLPRELKEQIMSFDSLIDYAATKDHDQLHQAIMKKIRYYKNEGSYKLMYMEYTIPHKIHFDQDSLSLKFGIVNHEFLVSIEVIFKEKRVFYWNIENQGRFGVVNVEDPYITGDEHNFNIVGYTKVEIETEMMDYILVGRRRLHNAIINSTLHELVPDIGFLYPVGMVPSIDKEQSLLIFDIMSIYLFFITRYHKYWNANTYHMLNFNETTYKGYLGYKNNIYVIADSDLSNLYEGIRDQVTK